MIACVRMPFLAVHIARRTNPHLQDTPLVIAQSGRVAAVSQDAAREAVRPGMRLSRARALCPDLQVVDAVRVPLEQALEEMMEALAAFTPQVEVATVMPAATVYLDLGPGPWEENVDMVQRVGQVVREQVGLAPAVGLAEGQFPAYVAALLADANEGVLVPPGRQRALLAPLSVHVLPLDAEAARRLALLSVHTLGDLAALPTGAVLQQLGARGGLWHGLARGMDNRPVRPYRARTVLRVAREFTGPVIEREVIEGTLRQVADTLAARLHTLGRTARQVEMVLYLEDGGMWEKSLVLRRPVASKERLTRVLTEMLVEAQVSAGVVGVTVTLEDLVTAVGEQMALLPAVVGDEGGLQDMLQDLVARHGGACFYRVALVDPTARLPEQRFCLQPMDVS